MAFKLVSKQHVDITGLDVGSAAAKLVCLKKSHGDYTLTAAHQEMLPTGDEAVTSEAYTTAVRNCLKSVGLQGKNVVCGVSGTEVVVRSFKFSPLPEQAVEQAVNMEARQVCPFDVNQSVVDFQLVEGCHHQQNDKNGKVRPRCGVMTVATERVVREKVSCIEKAGGTALMVDVNALALLNCLNTFGDIPDRGTVAVIDVGAAMTNVIIYGQDGLPFVRDVTAAGSRVIRDIAAKVNLSEKEVLSILSDTGSTDHQDQILLAMNDAIRPLAGAINETLRFYSFQEKETDIERIYLCGGYALLNAFVEFLTDALSIPVTVLNPFAHMKYEKQIDPKIIQSGPLFAVATGLAVRTLS